MEKTSVLPSVDPTTTEAWGRLQEHYEATKDVAMKQLFDDDAQRFETFSYRFEDILVDCSKNRTSRETRELLVALANECGLKDAIEAQFAGVRINATENRAVLHTALRNRSNSPVFFDDKDVMPAVNAVLEQVENFSTNPVSYTHLTLPTTSRV